MSDAVLVALIASVAPSLVAAAGVIVSIRNSRKIDEVHKTVNSGLSKQLADAGKAGELKGRTDERNENPGG